MTVTEVIKDLLKARGFSQAELAEALGTTRQNLSNKLNRDNFTVRDLCAIGKILGFSLIFKTDEEYVIEYDKK